MVPAVSVAVLEGMVSVGVETDLRLAFCERTVTMAPPGALVVTLEQMCGTEETSEEATLAVVRLPRLSAPPLPEKVPSQAAVWEPTLKVIWGSTWPATVTWSSSTMVTWPEPESLLQVMV